MRAVGRSESWHLLGLVDPQLTSVRLVLNPEKMVVAEAQRTYTYLSLFGYPTDLVVANRIVPSDVIDPYFAGWKDAQAAQLEKIREGFQPLYVKTVPLFGNGVMGPDALRCMATAAFGEDDDPHQALLGGAHTNDRADVSA